MKRITYALALTLAVAMALSASAAAASLLTIAKARQVVSQKAAHACAGTCISSGVRGVSRLSSSKVSAVAFVTTKTQSCTDKMIVTRSSTGGVTVQADRYPAAWACTPR